MADASWKREERIIASIFGTHRRLMKGTDEKSDIGDENFPLVLDVKLRKKNQWKPVKWFSALEKQASEQGKWPVLCLREPGKLRRYAIVRETYLSKFISDRTSYVAENFYIGSTNPSRNLPILMQWDKFIKIFNKKRMELKNNLLRSSQKHDDVFPILVFKNTKINVAYAILTPESLASIFRCGGLIK